MKVEILDLLRQPVRQDAVFELAHELGGLLGQGKSEDLLVMLVSHAIDMNRM